MVDLYNKKDLQYKYHVGDKVTWNNKVFERCPLALENNKEVKQLISRFVRVEDTTILWNWWEIVPTKWIKKPLYWIKFYIWYLMKFKRL